MSFQFAVIEAILPADRIFRYGVAGNGGMLRPTREKGSGIGLAMVRQLVHRNGGAVRYARPVGGGARFIITF